jgi:hypothetical protein
MINMGAFNPVNGPVFVDSAQPGDTLQVDILCIENSAWGWTGLFPGFRLLVDEFPEPVLKIWILEPEGFVWFDEKNIKVPLRPFAGTMGVAQKKNRSLFTIPPYHTGGISIRGILRWDQPCFFQSVGPWCVTPALGTPGPTARAKVKREPTCSEMAELMAEQRMSRQIGWCTLARNSQKTHFQVQRQTYNVHAESVKSVVCTDLTQTAQFQDFLLLAPSHFDNNNVRLWQLSYQKNK